MNFITAALAAFFFIAVMPVGAQEPKLVWEVGKEAPELEGEDENRVLRKLSDARGKYAVLDISTAWCYPSFVLAHRLAAVKERLRENGSDLVIYTVVYEDPARRGMTLRSQALAWKREFPGTDVVLSYYGEPFLNMMPAAGALLGDQPDQSFPTYAIIDPQGIVTKIGKGAATEDELLAEFLPDQPPIEPVQVPAPLMTARKATLQVQVGKKKGSSRSPFFDLGAAYAIPSIQRGDFPTATYDLGISKERAPRQESWILHFDTSGAFFADPNDPGIPGDQEVYFILSDVEWEGPQGVLASSTATYLRYDNVLGTPSVGFTDVRYRDGKVVVGPMHPAMLFYHCRYLTAQVQWVVPNLRLLSVFGADETARIAPLPVEDGSEFVAKWREIEAALPKEEGDPSLALSLVRQLRGRIATYDRSGKRLPFPQRGVLLGILDRMKQKLADPQAR